MPTPATSTGPAPRTGPCSAATAPSPVTTTTCAAGAAATASRSTPSPSSMDRDARVPVRIHRPHPHRRGPRHLLVLLDAPRRSSPVTVSTHHPGGHRTGAPPPSWPPRDPSADGCSGAARVRSGQVPLGHNQLVDGLTRMIGAMGALDDVTRHANQRSVGPTARRPAPPPHRTVRRRDANRPRPRRSGVNTRARLRRCHAAPPVAVQRRRTRTRRHTDFRDDRHRSSPQSGGQHRACRVGAAHHRASHRHGQPQPSR